MLIKVKCLRVVVISEATTIDLGASNGIYTFILHSLQYYTIDHINLKTILLIRPRYLPFRCNTYNIMLFVMLSV